MKIEKERKYMKSYNYKRKNLLNHEKSFLNFLEYMKK